MKKAYGENCEGCFYYSYLAGRSSSGIKICSYLLKTGKPRGCSPEDCEKYTKDEETGGFHG